MVRISVRIDDALYERLNRRATGADLSFSTFVRSVLEQAADPGGRYIYSSQDEILATCIQILSIVATATGQQSPKALEQAKADAREMLLKRGLLGRDGVR
ncbi:CopG family transcriptional regulator [Sphingobium sp. V4]|uniref:CopG family transcriptional regulator n=1 Tax=Sphingobium sp. V4 TaxID=3038927 RepID=UPI002557EB0B|nr:CopG family transcriptional regulator [Sphingobium sp. V4]WIW89634.1 CopG family transcriptional regulator [Sphingobium sp. V4]